MTTQSTANTDMTLVTAAQGPYLAATYLKLAAIAYSDENATLGRAALKAVAKAIPTLPLVTVPGDASQSGTLTYEWGAASELDANLAFAVSGKDTAEIPQFAVVVLRGTDVGTDDLGKFKQICEDLRCDRQLDWAATVSALSNCTDLPAAVDQPYSNPAIALGTAQGLQKILSMQASDRSTLATWVQNFVNNNPGVPVVITGHSLGGCQTIVLAQYLAQTLTGSPVLVSQPWAPPTPGNQAFADLYDTAFGTRSFVWWNTLDIVPNAFQNMTGIPALWTDISMNAAENLIFTGINDELTRSQCTYAQSAATTTTLTGQQPASGTSWSSELCVQHFPPMYEQLLSQNSNVWSYDGIATTN